MSMKILYVVNSSAFFNSHFKSLAQYMLKNGFEVYIASGDDALKFELESHGFHFVDIVLFRKSRSVFKEIYSICSIYKIINEINPDVMHMFTINLLYMLV